MTILTNGIDWGSRLSGEAVTYFFAPPRETYATPVGRVTTEKWTAYERQQFAEALATFETFTNLELHGGVEPSGRRSHPRQLGGGSERTARRLRPSGHQVRGNRGCSTTRARAGTRTAGGGLEQGGYGFITLIHEFGHGLGLAHPHDNGGTSTVMPGVTGAFGDYGDFDLNQGVFTMMSYNDGWQTAPARPPPSDDYGYQGTLMALDIAVLQEKYGANTQLPHAATTSTSCRPPTRPAPSTPASGTPAASTRSPARRRGDAVHRPARATLASRGRRRRCVSYAARHPRRLHHRQRRGDRERRRRRGRRPAHRQRGRQHPQGRRRRRPLDGRRSADDVLTGAADRDTFVFEAVRDSEGGKRDRPDHRLRPGGRDRPDRHRLER